MIRTERLLFVLLLALAPIAVLAPKGTVVVVAAGLAITLVGQPPAASLAAFVRPTWPLLVAALMLWSLASLAWTLEPAVAFSVWLRMLWIMAGGVLLVAGLEGLDAAAARRLEGAVALFGVLFAALMVIELASDGVLTRLVRLGRLEPPYSPDYLARSAALLAIFAWPAGLALWRRAGAYAALGFYLVVLVLLYLLPMAAALAAFVAASVVFAAAMRWPRATLGAVGAATLLAIALMPLVFALGDPVTEDTLPGLPSSWRHRLAIWQFVAERVAERPWQGWGLDSSRHMPGAGDSIYGRHGLLPLHPHNAVMQVWLELGLPGAVLGAALVVLVLAAVRRAAATPRRAAVRLAVFVSFLSLALASYGVWQNWWLAAGWLAGFVSAIAAGEGED
jgi:O-antigen ligase